MTKLLKIVITGGGTGGHVFPALALAEELRDRGFDTLYVGSDRGLEAKLAPQKQIPFLAVQSGAIKNQGILKSVISLWKVFTAVLWSIQLLRKRKPSAIVGVGGYVSVPICVAGFLLRIPVFLQEQNASVGIANRFLGRLATQIFLGFEQAKSSFPAHKCIFTGNPIRKEFFQDKISPPDLNKRSLLILGGSQGARSINNAIASLLDRIHQKFPSLFIFHQTGKLDYDSVLKAYEASSLNQYDVRPFIEDMVSAYQQATLVISRSGALTVSEILAAQRPTIFVPYPRQGQNDQTANAKLLQKQGVARVVEQGDQFEDRLWIALEEAFSGPNLAQMAQQYSGLHQTNGLATIGHHIQEAITSNEQ